MYAKWETVVAYYKAPGEPSGPIVSNPDPMFLYFKEGSEMCPSFKDPHHDVISSLNKLMVLAAFQRLTWNVSAEQTADIHGSVGC